MEVKEVFKDIKAYDKVANIGDRMKNINIKVKDDVNENTNQVDNISPEQYATDKVTENIKSGVEGVAVVTENITKNSVLKTKEKIGQKKEDKNTNTKIHADDSSPQNLNPRRNQDQMVKNHASPPMKLRNPNSENNNHQKQGVNSP